MKWNNIADGAECELGENLELRIVANPYAKWFDVWVIFDGDTLQQFKLTGELQDAKDKALKAVKEFLDTLRVCLNESEFLDD